MILLLEKGKAERNCMDDFFFLLIFPLENYVVRRSGSEGQPGLIFRLSSYVLLVVEGTRSHTFSCPADNVGIQSYIYR